MMVISNILSIFAENMLHSTIENKFSLCSFAIFLQKIFNGSLESEAFNGWK